MRDEASTLATVGILLIAGDVLVSEMRIMRIGEVRRRSEGDIYDK